MNTVVSHTSSMDYSNKTQKELIAICKEKGIKGYSGKNKDYIIKLLTNTITIKETKGIEKKQKVHVKTPATLLEQKFQKSEDLETIKDVLENKEAQRGLISLYKQSQSECTKNGKIGPEVGMFREKDQCALLKLFLNEKINLDINNDLPEDFIVLNTKVSSKHSCGKVGSSLKVKWTSADTSVKEDIEHMIYANDSYYPSLLITYLDIKNKKITIFCITSEHNKNVIKTLKEDAFKIAKGNSRGIEYSRTAMDCFITNPYFKIEISNADITCGVNPIERRIQILNSIGIIP